MLERTISSDDELLVAANARSRDRVAVALQQHLRPVLVIVDDRSMGRRTQHSLTVDICEVVNTGWDILVEAEDGSQVLQQPPASMVGPEIV